MPMLKWNFIRLALVGLLVLTIAAACGADPTPTPQPTATPPPTATPIPTEPPLLLEDLQIDSETTGGELFARISEAEAACLSSAMGEANFDLLRQSPLMLAVSQEGSYSLLAACLEQDNLIVLGVGLISAKNGGWEPSSLECVTTVSREHPELVYYALNLADRIPHLDHSEAHVEFPTIYQCLTPVEQVTLMSVIQSGPPIPFTGETLLNVLPEADVECLRNTLTEAEFSAVAEAPALFATGNEELPPQAFACFSPQAMMIVLEEIVMLNFGASSEPSRNCMRQVFSEHENLVALLAQGSEVAESLTPEQFSETASNIFLLLDCLTEDEFLVFQETHMINLVP